MIIVSRKLDWSRVIFKSYDEYLESPHWKTVRTKRIERDGFRCVRCGTAKNLQVHHLSYDNFGQEDIEHDLVTLCRKCHEDVHRFDIRGRPQTIDAETKRLADYARRRDRSKVHANEFMDWALSKDVMFGGTENLLSMQTLGTLKHEYLEDHELPHNEFIYLQDVWSAISAMKNQRILQLYKAGMPTEQISKEVGLGMKNTKERIKHMRVANWEEVEEKSTSSLMGPGAYVVQITDINDNEDWEQLEVIYDVVEGEFAGKFKDATPDEDWKHRFYQKYSEKAQGFFKGFLKELATDNPKFVIKDWQSTCDPRAFIGLKLGVLFRERRYINDSGEAKWGLEIVTPMSIEAVRNGEWTMPEPRYHRCDESEWTAKNTFGGETKVSESTGSYDDVPFL